MLVGLTWLMAQSAGYSDGFAGDVVNDGRGGWILRRGARDIAIRELGDVFSDGSLAARGMLRRIPSSGSFANVLGSPYPLALTPPAPGAMIGEAGADRDSVLQDWTVHPGLRGEVA
jgi:hypothetical protein